MVWIRIMLASAMIALPLAAHAAEMALAPVHKVHATKVHHARIHLARSHFGYYWGRWGWRTGGTARSWYGSTFAFLEPRWW